MLATFAEDEPPAWIRLQEAGTHLVSFCLGTNPLGILRRIDCDLVCGDGSADACLAFAAQKLEAAVEPYGDVKGDHAGASSAGHACAVPRWGVDVHRHGGDDSTMNVGHVGAAPDYMQSAGPSYRQVVDLRDASVRSPFLSPLGQSGDMFDRLYDNLLEDWGVGRYLKMGPDPRPGDGTRVCTPVHDEAWET